ncbi:unnamed protein product [Tetraodon nigroviridis]|uniref:Endoplasmic reticulum membrane protein complex subunit 7 n=1 Tax=Tetraodon nigroviridis TaxID=99883 RepID=Q4S754_TETNG|nr:unnamed protein product [Tetraodon nigroviridis]
MIMIPKDRILLLCLSLHALIAAAFCFADMETGPGAVVSTPPNGDRFKIEGRAIVPGIKTHDWVSTARVLVDGEEYIGFLKTDGSFAVNDVPSGSYVVEVVSPGYRFEPVRVDITSKGKMRARLVNYIKTSEVFRQPYPLQMKSSGPHRYFMNRETWGWTDFLMNPMVMMMVLPLLIIVLLPKVVNTNDPEMRKVSICYVFCIVWNSLHNRMSHMRPVTATWFQIYNTCTATVYGFSGNNVEKHNKDFKDSTWKIPSVSFSSDAFFTYRPCVWASEPIPTQSVREPSLFLVGKNNPASLPAALHLPPSRRRFARSRWLSLQEIEQSMNMLSPNPELPDMSELVTKFFSGSKGPSKAGGGSKGGRPAVKRR